MAAGAARSREVRLTPRTRREGRLKVVSLNVGLPRVVEWEGDSVLTSIFKDPVKRRLRVSILNVEGDEQSDLTVHGGIDKAVYVYPSELAMQIRTAHSLRARGSPSRSNLHRNEIDLGVKAAGNSARARPPVACRQSVR